MMPKFFHRFVAALVPAIALSACSYGPSGGDLGSTGMTQVVDTMPAPAAGAGVPAGQPYAIGPYDKLQIGVFGIEGMEPREVVADSAGRISFPLAGSIDAAGKSPDEVAAIIAQRLRANYVRDPQVTVNVTEAISQVVTVDGQVKQPGVYPVTGNMTLMRSVALAKGLDEFAKADDVVILRTVGDQRYAGLYNLAAIRRGNYPDPQVYANDTVIVGESRQRRIFKDILQIVPLLTTPVIVALQNN
ncbi:polysaccharide biosynthesis/export family protein [Tsuneonella sp. SYSU-LHT278]